MAFNSSSGSSQQQLSSEQKRRIDQNFRAAKAILSSKRPPTAPLCRSPRTWGPSLCHERNQFGQNGSPRPPEKHAGGSEHKKRFQENTPGLANCNIGKSVFLQSVTPQSNPSHIHRQGTPPFNCDTSLIADMDLDESMLRQLDILYEARAPLAQLSENKFNTPESRAQHDPYQPVLVKEDTREQCLQRDLLSVVDALPTAGTCKSPLIACQLTTDETTSVLPARTGSEHNVQDKSESLLIKDDTSSNFPHMFATATSLVAASSCDDQLQRSTAIIKTVNSPIISTAYGSSSEVSSASSHESCVPTTEAPSYLQTLNECQKEAALSDTHKPLLILAGPGSGKTSTMVARVLTLLNEGGVSAANILAMTFTTAAAAEMRDRVGALVGKTISKELNVCTFHSFCLQLCRSHAEKLGRTPEFLVYGHGQQRKAVIGAIRLALAELQSSKDAVDTDSKLSTTAEKGQLSDGQINPMVWKERSKKWDKFVTQAKASGKAPEDYEKIGDSFGAAVLRNYNATLAACDALDYHDFISCAVALLRDNSEVLNMCQTTWTCILVDEFQDTSAMQYHFLHLLASHKRVTIVGDDDQSIFSFNGADSNGFESFRKDFPDLKEVRLHHNYRSTLCIVEAASSLIKNNLKRCENKQTVTDNDFGEKISVKECRNEQAQCSFAIDTILMKAHMDSMHNPIYGDIAILYRRQVSGKNFQSALRSRKIPFNVHGVAFYRKKVIKTVIAMLWTAYHGGSTIHCSRVYKALYAGEKAEAKKMVEYVEKVARTSQCDFLEASRRIFTAKVSGTFTRQQLANGRKVLSSIEAVCKLTYKEQSLSALITAVVNLVPQRSAFQKRAVVDEDGGKFLNEDDDPRTVLEYLLEDVSDFLCNHFKPLGRCNPGQESNEVEQGCLTQLKAFLDYMTSREKENFKARRKNNRNSVTLTTMHQSKGLEWDIVFIVKANDSEIPLLHETMGTVGDGAMSLEEERRLFYVAMTRARKKLYILYVMCDNNHQLLRPTRFLGELPHHLLDYQVDGINSVGGTLGSTTCPIKSKQQEHGDDSSITSNSSKENKVVSGISYVENVELAASTEFLRGFNVEARSTIASLFHSWAKKPAFQDPKRLLDKVCFVLDERLRSKGARNKDTLWALKSSLTDKEALLYAQHVVKWVQIPHEERMLLQSERQEYFQQKSSEHSMASAAATSKQVSYLHKLGCTIEPTSRLHASRLIEQYKAL